MDDRDAEALKSMLNSRLRTQEAVERFHQRDLERRKVVSLHDKREQSEEQKHHQARLMMLMHSFLEAEAKGDHDSMRMYGRGISGYERDERNQAYAAALEARRLHGVTVDDQPTADGPGATVTALRPPTPEAG